MSDTPSQPSQNPFAAPNPTDPLPPNDSGRPPGYGSRPGRGYVRQIPILAVMTIVQGVLLSLMGIACLGYGILFAVLLQTDNANRQPNGPPLEIISAAGIGIGLLILIIAALNITGGIRTLKYRGRVFTIVAWMLGLLASFTCYCGPTSVGLAIWGMIVFLNPAVVSAFKMAETGMTSREIEDQFY